MRHSTKLFTASSAAFIATLAIAFPAMAGGNHDSHAGMKMPQSMPENHDMHGGMSMSDTVEGTVVSVDQRKRKLLLDHESMPHMGMDAMKMSFVVADGVSLKALKEGQRVLFTVAMVADAGMQITAISPAK